jgi:hypothetical protein
MLMITTFVELRVVAGRSRKRAGRLHAVSGRPMLIHTCHAHAALCRGLEKSLSERHSLGMARARHGMCELGLWASSCLFICPTAWNRCAPTERIFMKLGIWVFLENHSRIQVWLRSDKNNGYCTWELMYIYVDICLNSQNEKCHRQEL